jgi:hypothetical protein
MIIDNKGRLFGKISIIDILIISVLLVIATAGYRYIAPKAAGPLPDNQDKLQIVFYQEEVNDFTANTVNKGDPAKDAILHTSLGQVVDVKTDKSVSWIKSDKGEYFSSSKEGYSSVFITMEVNGTLAGSGAVIGGSTYYIGQIVTLHAGNAAFYGRIYSIKKI